MANPATQFKPGESGNPNGRRKGSKNVKATYEELLNADKIEMIITINGAKKRVNIDTNGNTLRDAICALDMARALAGKDKAIDRILDRTEGKPTQKQEIDLKGQIQPFIVDSDIKDIISGNENGEVGGEAESDTPSTI